MYIASKKIVNIYKNTKNVFQYVLLQALIQFFYLFSNQLWSNLVLIFSSLYIFTVFLHLNVKDGFSEVKFHKELLYKMRFYFPKTVRMSIVFLLGFLVTYIPLIAFFIFYSIDTIDSGIENHISIQLTWIFQCFFLSYASCIALLKEDINYYTILQDSVIYIFKNILLSLAIIFFFLLVLIAQIYWIRNFLFIDDMRLMISIPISFAVLFIHDRIRHKT